jgi:hypothetical protein
MELPELGNGDNHGVEEARLARRETAGFRTTCSGTGVLAVIFISLLHRAGIDGTNE